MKKVLIITPTFAPRNYVTSIRATKLAKYFNLLAGYSVSVITNEISENDIIDPILNSELKYVDKLTTITSSRLLRKLRKIPGVLKVDRNHFERQLAKYCEKAEGSYDVVLSTSPPLIMHIAAAKMKKRYPNTFWIADFRDPINKHSTPKERASFFKAFNDNKLGKPDIITGISDGCLVDFKEAHQERLYVIRNGFDRDDLDNITPLTNDKFTLTYAGKLYNRDLSVVFRAIDELISEKKLDRDKIQINYAGSQEELFKKQASQYNIAEIVKIYGWINRRKSLQLQVNSSILLLASWNNDEQTGIMTGKFYEYLMVEKPIVCTVVGNLPNSELKYMTEEANAGIVWEEANSDTDYPLLKSYILEQYNRFIQNKPLLYEPNHEYIGQFSYKIITRRLLDLINNTGESNDQST